MPEQAMSEEDAVLAANEEFYRAFAARDLAAMDALWAQVTPVACIHPGWDALVGREAVMESWAAILGGPGAPQIRCEAPRAFVKGQSAFVICREVLEQGRLIATNVFAREQDGWRMVHHQAGPSGQAQPAPPRASARPRRCTDGTASDDAACHLCQIERRRALR